MQPATLKVNQKPAFPRYFKHPRGFQDGTKYVRVDDAKSVYCVSDNEVNQCEWLTLKNCIDFYTELTAEEAAKVLGEAK